MHLLLTLKKLCLVELLPGTIEQAHGSCFTTITGLKITAIDVFAILVEDLVRW